MPVHRCKSTVRSQRKLPEFDEYFVKYPLKIDRYSSHRVAQRLVGAGQRVLDIGSGEGYVAQGLEHDGNTMTGVDIIPVPGERDAFSKYVCGSQRRLRSR